jgi:Mn-dependent DtxR family transcriptional regulator
MNMRDLSRTEVTYLETIYRMNENHVDASVSALAKKFGVRLPSAIGILDKLEAKGLVIRKPWRIPELSKRGATITESVMHQHRIVELYLNKKLGVDSKLSCVEASKIDYLLDGEVVEKMCIALNRPSRCLHGYPIQHGD